jgi:hypothetical protein
VCISDYMNAFLPSFLTYLLVSSQAEDTGIYITEIIEGGAADQSGKLFVGDKVRTQPIKSHLCIVSAMIESPTWQRRAFLCMHAFSHVKLLYVLLCFVSEMRAL